MTSWKVWFARTQSPMIERRASPGSRARRSFETLANCCSAVSSSSRSWGVIFAAAISVASASSSARTMNASCSSSREIVRTRTPRFGTQETSPSAASRRSASRIGVRETSNCSESCSWRRTVPGSSWPETIASSITRAMSSAFVVSRVMRRVYGRSARLLPSGVPLRAFELDVGLRLQRLGGVDETSSLPARLLTIAQRVPARENRLVGPLERLVLRNGQRHPLLAAVVAALAEECPRLPVALGEVEALDRHPHLAVQLLPRRRALASLVRQKALPGQMPPGRIRLSGEPVLLVVVVAFAEVGARALGELGGAGRVGVGQLGLLLLGCGQPLAHLDPPQSSRS